MRKIIAILGTLGVAASVLTVSAAPVPDATLLQKLEGKTRNEKVVSKANEIVRLRPVGKYANAQYGVQVEILDIEKIEGGVQLFARAWKGTDQLGFGADGSVDIERFRIYNPPILVDDPNGSHVVNYTDREGVAHQDKFRLDPVQAIREVIAHNVKLVGKLNTSIVPGKVGNTTSTFFPDPDTESTSVDGTCLDGSSTVWATVHDKADCSNPTDSSMLFDVYSAEGAADSFYNISRGFSLYDTSAIPDTDTISSATNSYYVIGTVNGDNDGQDYITVVTTTPASNTAIVGDDYEQIGTTKQSDDLDITGLTNGAYNDFTINATGLANISKTGITKFGVREGHDLENDAIALNANNTASMRSADFADTTSDPKLVIVHVAAASAVPPRRPPVNIIMTLQNLFLIFRLS